METSDDKTTEEVMNCLLSMSKIQSTEQDVQYWPNYQDGEPAIIWKLDGDDGVVQVPIEYKIEKYVLTQSLSETRQEGDTPDSNKLVFIQNLPTHSAHYGGISFVDGPVYEQQTVTVAEPEPEPASFRTDSSYSESIDVEVDDLDPQEPFKSCAAELIFSSPKKEKTKKAAVKTVASKRKQKRTKKWLKKVREDTINAKKAGKQKKVDAGGVSIKASPETKPLAPKYDELTRLEDNAEQVAHRFKSGCECATNCFDGFSAEKVFRHRLNIADLTKAEHDMYLMGVIHASMQNPEETCRKKERLRIRTTYAYHGKRVCLTAFLYLEHVTLYQMKRLRKHLQHHGVTPRIHGNHGRKPSNTLPLDIYQHATQFVQHFIEQHHLKNSTDSNKNKSTSKSTCYRLPADYTKKTLHEEYRRYCQQSMPMGKIMQYSTFTNFFKKQFPNVKFRKPEKFIEKRLEETQEVAVERQRKARKKCKNKVVQTCGPSADVQVQVDGPCTQQYSPYLILGNSQVLLDADAPFILRTPSDGTHFMADEDGRR